MQARPVLCSLLVVAMLLPGCTTPSSSASTQDASPYDYLAELKKAEADLDAAGDDSSKRRFPLTMLATHQSFVGDTERAIETFRASRTRPQRGSRVDGVVDADVRDALAAVVEAVRDRQIVMINEAHHVPRDRAFSTLVAIELRKVGFEYLAVETLEHRRPEATEALAARGYPLVEDGYYSRDPVFGDLIRRALSVGYRPVAYEHSEFEESNPELRQARREEGQARNIVERIFAKDPGARVLVHVGYGHLLKASEEGISTTKVMAEYLREKTGIDPYCIDQTQSLWADATIARALIDAAPSDVFVVTPRDAARPYLGSPAVDMFVFHKPVRIVDGRPHWLAMGGYRAPRRIPDKLLPKSGRRLVQAFVASESADAVPMDQVLVEAGKPPPVLMLPKGKYRFAFQD